MTSADVAFLFPGQGAHRREMLDGILGHRTFRDRYDTVCDALGAVPHLECERDASYINRNAVSSLLTVLASSISLDLYVERHGFAATYLAGYSVGQWSALYAAGCLSFDDLVEVICRRAECMDACGARHRGAMMAVIGVALTDVERFCEDLRHRGHLIFVSNYNCAGQCSLSGEADAIAIALAEVRALDPKIAAPLPTQGAWHCPLLTPAADEFARWLERLDLALPRVPVMNNVTGDAFPSDLTAMKTDLVRHLTHPVRWDRSIRTLLGCGCRTLVEIGFGNTLTKFGYFVDRSVSHTSFYA